MSTAWHLPFFIVASLLAFLGVLRIVTRGRSSRPSWQHEAWLAGIVVVGGMLFAKFGVASGWPVWVYYGAPAALTWCLPPIALRMRAGELARFIGMALLVAPAIHVLFSLVLGWKEYLPFLPVPSLRELLA